MTNHSNNKNNVNNTTIISTVPQLRTVTSLAQYTDKIPKQQPQNHYDMTNNTLKVLFVIL